MLSMFNGNDGSRSNAYQIRNGKAHNDQRKRNGNGSKGVGSKKATNQNTVSGIVEHGCEHGDGTGNGGA